MALATSSLSVPGRLRRPDETTGLTVMLGTAVESNRSNELSEAPAVDRRANDLHALACQGSTTMVTIEPILDFDIYLLVDLVKRCKPEWINLGADSKGNYLPEPSAEKVKELITELSEFTQVKVKNNLTRIVVYTRRPGAREAGDKHP